MVDSIIVASRVLGLLIVWGCLFSIAVVLVPAQWVELKRPQDELSPLRKGIFRCLIYILITALIPIIARQLMILGFTNEFVMAAAGFSSALGFYFFTHSLFFVLRYNKHKYWKKDK